MNKTYRMIRKYDIQQYQAQVNIAYNIQKWQLCYKMSAIKPYYMQRQTY